ncbi:MAG: SIS domain-containing protein [Patescibacteria group bacterium]
MSFLDKEESLFAIDRSRMADALQAIPARVRAIAQTPFPAVDVDRHALTSIVVIGLGGSAIGGDLAAAMVMDQCTLPIIVLRGSVLPHWVQSSTFVVAVSYSGNTAETIAAFRSARERRCPLVAIASGGKLAAAATDGGVPLLNPGTYSQPRLAVGAMTVLLLNIISSVTRKPCDDQLAVVADAYHRVTSSVTPDVPTETNRAKMIAYQLLDRLPVVVAGGVLGPVARRWKTQLNENAKSLCVVEEMPELFHNTLEGLKLPVVASDSATWVFLEAPADQSVPLPQLDHFATLLKKASLRVERVRASLDNPHAALWWMIGMGDWVSYYLACLNNVDPTPVETIQAFKKPLV